MYKKSVLIASYTKQICGKQWHFFLQQMSHFPVVSVGRLSVSRKIRVYSEKWKELLRGGASERNEVHSQEDVSLI
jgi:hypothetical protein